MGTHPRDCLRPSDSRSISWISRSRRVRVCSVSAKVGRGRRRSRLPSRDRTGGTMPVGAPTPAGYEPAAPFCRPGRVRTTCKTAMASDRWLASANGCFGRCILRVGHLPPVLSRAGRNGTADASNPASPGSCGKWVVAEPATTDHSSVAVPPCSWLRASLEAIHSLVSGRFQHRLPERELH